MSAPSEPTGDGARAWLHDGQSAARHDVIVAVEGDSLSVEGFGTVPLAALWRQDGAKLVYGREDVKGWRLGFDDPPPAALLARLPSPMRYGRLIDRIGYWRAAAIGLCLSALVLLGAVRGLELLAYLIPYSWEQRLGDTISGDFGDYACREPHGQKLLDALAHRLSPSQRPMRVSLVDIPVVNAVALPAGRILLFRGLIDKAASPDEVAGVLAHEIGHVEHRHVMVALLRRFGIGILLGSGGKTAEYGSALVESRYSRAAESEADDYAITHLVAAGISPAATATLFERLGRDEPATPRLLDYIASHPPSTERQQRFAAAARGISRARPALAPAQWTAVRAMCGKERAEREFNFRF